MKGLLAGYLELKPPGTGARPEKFKGHDRQQWQRFQALPNLLYTDGNEWALFQEQRVAGLARLSGDVTTDGQKAVSAEDAAQFADLAERFLSWEPLVPRTAKQLAATLAPLCRLLREDVTDALKHSDAFVTVARDWRELLFPEASDAQFADAYAQTVTYGLLLARAAGASPLDVTKAAKALRGKHTLLARALEILTDEQLESEIVTSLRLLQRVIDRVDPKAFTDTDDPWLYFYEDFLAEYDPKLRKDAGVYYTPVEVVLAQIRLIDELLVHRIGRKLGFAADDVVTLDPGVGTGTYLIGAIDHALAQVKAIEGAGAIPGRASVLARNLHGFEIMVGPYSVAELRVSQSLARYGATFPPDGPHIYLTDTLESPTSTPKAPPLFLAPLAKEHERARQVKESVPVLVVLGNPPYDRHEASKKTGGWVRWGDKGEIPILETFLKPAREASYGIHLKNLYNLYVYFWRWALWKVFEHTTAQGAGVVSFISASSYLDGPAFVGMREYLRRIADEIWIIDLGGEQRGTRKSENVFAIQTPVAIAIAARYGSPQPTSPARISYARIEGSRDEKLQALKAIRRFSDLSWSEGPSGWLDTFRPGAAGAYVNPNPKLT